ncbi:hypothetical protein VTJ49DRAFT_2622 [Mycothermus thermophilus]|uniref:DUF7730 domain-containing protein n=1 Tax=Humicola insolens TaxID=85995 RepID=A0ABR3V9G7_HUMIN
MPGPPQNIPSSTAAFPFITYTTRDGSSASGSTAGCSPSAPNQPNEQLESPLFGMLPAELRAMIFTELFGGRRVHLEFMTHPLRADKVGNRRRWRHGVCEDDPSSVPFSRVAARQHYCLTAARRRVLDISMLFTCRRALVECIPILYQRNVFLIINTGSRRLPVDDIRSLQAKVPKHWPLIQSLEIKWEVAPFDRNQASMVPHFGGRDAYEAFWDALAEMPALTRLRIALLMPRWSPTHLTPSVVDLRESYLGPIGRLKHLRVCEVIMPKSYMSLFGDDECDSFVATPGGLRHRISWVDDDPGSLATGPAMANIFHLLPMALT